MEKFSDKYKYDKVVWDDAMGTFTYNSLYDRGTPKQQAQWDSEWKTLLSCWLTDGQSSERHFCYSNQLACARRLRRDGKLFNKQRCDKEL
jgi:hypothetical protein